MVLTILQDHGFKPLHTCQSISVDVVPVTAKAQYHIDRLSPVLLDSTIQLREEVLATVEDSGSSVETWVSSTGIATGPPTSIDGENILRIGSSHSHRGYSAELTPLPSSYNSSAWVSGRPFDLAVASSQGELQSFSDLPSVVRDRIWTYHATDQTPRTVSTGSILWEDGVPIDNNQPLPIHQICRETRAAKSSLYGRHGYKVLHLSVLTCTTPRARGYVSIVIHPSIDLLHITNDFLSSNGCLLPSYHGIALMQDLHLCNLLSSIQHLGLCTHDANFEFMISHLPHFTNLKMLFIVTGTHYVKFRQDEDSERVNRFDAESADATIWWRPDAHGYLVEDFLARIIRPFYIWREQAGYLVSAEGEAEITNPTPNGIATEDHIVVLRSRCPLPQIRVVSRVNWFSEQETVRRVRDRMENVVGGGSGHFVLSEARYGRVRAQEETSNYEKRQVRGGRKRSFSSLGFTVGRESAGKKRKRM